MRRVCRSRRRGSAITTSTTSRRNATIALTSVVIAAAWVYLGTLAWGMHHMDRGMSMWLMPRMTGWGLADLALVFLMWAVMMAAMMLPSVVPVITASMHGVESTRFGAVRAGVRNGLHCLGCCWALMTMLFATGVMNMPWIVILAVYVLLEKTAPGAARFSRAAGALLCAAGLALAVGFR